MASTLTASETLRPLMARLHHARLHTDALFARISPDALYERTIPERHRLIFYLGHLEAFDWNLLARGAFQLASHDAGLDRLFSFGIDPTNGNLPSDLPADWPREAHIRDYNDRCRSRIDAALLDPAVGGNLPPLVANGTLLHVAIEHRLMHAETLAYLLHQLPYDKKSANGLPAPAHSTAPATAPNTARIPRGFATLGQPAVARQSTESGDFPFGWDNEFDQLRTEVPEFSIGVFPVTNSQFLEFLRSGAYSDSRFWSLENWQWKQSHGLQHPFFWELDAGVWFWRGMFERIPLPPDWPVYVSHAEASAYARWAGKSLPTEAQWHRAAYGTPQGEERLYPWGDAAPAPGLGNFDCARWDPTSVSAHPAGSSAFGVQDLLGNGWEWTCTPFAPLPGFEPFAFYPGYSADFFDGRHFVMKGGSPRTAACLLRRPFRNWFQPRYPYVYAKFRCVEV